MKLIRIGSPILVLSLLKLPVVASPPPVTLPTSMGAIGDSISRAALAHLHRSDAKYPWVKANFLSRATGYGLFNLGKSLDKVGLSWSTGRGVRFWEDIPKRLFGNPFRFFGRHHPVKSHLYRLQKRLGHRLPSYNAAVTGQTSNRIWHQWQHLHAWSRKKLKQGAPDYVTLLIGANDVCQSDPARMTSVIRYQENVSEVVDAILHAHATTRLLIVAIPDVTQLYGVAAKAKLGGYGPFNMSCKRFWSLVKVCPTLTKPLPPHQRKLATERLHDYNNVLSEITQSRRQQFGDRIRFSAQVNDYQFHKNDLAIDCFHPNSRGQNHIADITWADSWWAD